MADFLQLFVRPLIIHVGTPPAKCRMRRPYSAPEGRAGQGPGRIGGWKRGGGSGAPFSCPCLWQLALAVVTALMAPFDVPRSSVDIKKSLRSLPKMERLRER